MIKEYYDTFLDKDAVTELNRDIEENPGVTFEIVGYTQTTPNDLFIRKSILVKWGTGFKENNSSCQKNI